MGTLAVLAVVAVVNAQTVHRSRPPVPLGAAEVSVVGVDSSRYTVVADVRVTNPGTEPMWVVGVISPGIAMSARGGLPEPVAAGGSVVLRVHMAIPACALLPARLGGFEVQLERGDQQATVGYLSEPGTALYRELSALADRICAAYQHRGG